jgi:hypothetical protein
VGVAKAKKTEPREHLIRWRVSLIKGTPAKFIDFAYAPTRRRPRGGWPRRTTSATRCAIGSSQYVRIKLRVSQP